jgi:hypothetical protein
MRRTFKVHIKKFAPAFQWSEQLGLSQSYLQGLLVSLADHFLVRLRIRF